jgi:hypothetical protein
MKHKTQRGTLTAKIKEAILSVFGESNLLPISMNASPRTISNWKRHPSVKECYLKLNKPIFEDEPEVTYILRIIERVFKDPKSMSDELMTYAIGVCEVFLDPNNENIQISESVMKDMIEKNLVSFAIIRK